MISETISQLRQLENKYVKALENIRAIIQLEDGERTEGFYFEGLRSAQPARHKPTMKFKIMEAANDLKYKFTSQTIKDWILKNYPKDELNQGSFLTAFYNASKELNWEKDPVITGHRVSYSITEND